MLRPPFQVCLRLLAGLIACLAASGVSAAEHATEQAKRSFYAGDFATARVRYQALAEEGYGEAQAALAGVTLAPLGDCASLQVVRFEDCGDATRQSGVTDGLREGVVVQRRARGRRR